MNPQRKYVTNQEILQQLLQTSRQFTLFKEEVRNQFKLIRNFIHESLEEAEEEWDGNSPYCSDTHNTDSEEECEGQKGTYHRHKLQRTQEQLWPCLKNDLEVVPSNPSSKECQNTFHSNSDEAFKED